MTRRGLITRYPLHRVALLVLLAFLVPGGAARAGRPAPREWPHRLLYVIPADPARTLMMAYGAPDGQPRADTLREAFTAAVRAEILARFTQVTVVQATAAQDSQLTAALADRSLFNRYDDLLVAHATLSEPEGDAAPGRVRATVTLAFRPWDPAETLTLTGEAEAGGSGETAEAAARQALERAVRQAADALTRHRTELVR